MITIFWYWYGIVGLVCFGFMLYMLYSILSKHNEWTKQSVFKTYLDVFILVVLAAAGSIVWPLSLGVGCAILVEREKS